MRVIGVSIGLLTAAMLAGCGGDTGLMNIEGGSDGPDEFAILPTKPLQMPPDLNQLPVPTPGGASITDPTPEADAVAALGGDPGRLAPTGIGAADGALVSYASRAGAAPGIRQVLAAEDEQFRAGRGRRLLEVLARTNVYYRAYEPQSLDPWVEQDRWRRSGAQVPSAPPPPLD
ncbi:DUF3035 domain-containing protein [Paracoccus sp. S-4012]|uniref:DUF3035 domain-containing protein n=1 Tax=Paracoccus sp. S-4012 TaxID=2665648 RepID=UPI0012B0CEDC|nr:DUF3035 domain-containing protein [Paracoccus sp. S-4012]MRX49640.1 DUF3035 domain-containing protein [Paracoccus sp. S-4012]